VRIPLLKLALVAVLAGMLPMMPAPNAYAEDCASTGATAYQPTYPEARAALIRAANGLLGNGYPRLPNMLSGSPDQRVVQASVPCVLPQAMGWFESGWRQAVRGTAQGARGAVLTGAGGCGVGLLQTSSGMRYPGQLPRATQQAIASDYQYNAAYGVRLLIDKWNSTPAVGANDPSIAEHWYYAIWAYNAWSWRNNPNNPDLPWPRPGYDGSQPVRNYPYQEIVFGLAANPPTPGGVPLWEPVELSLPDAGAIGTSPDAIPEPLVVHRSVCLSADPFVPVIADHAPFDYR
jgi:hypothetical protein